MLPQRVFFDRVFLIAILSFTISSVTAMPEGGSISPARAIEVSVIKGEQLIPLLNNKSENYSVMSVVDGQLVAIPYQFDDVNLRGFVYTRGGKLVIDGEEGIIEPQDQLAIMYKDTGPKATTEWL
jgi:hypothetical protein